MSHSVLIEKHKVVKLSMFIPNNPPALMKTREVLHRIPVGPHVFQNLCFGCDVMSLFPLSYLVLSSLAEQL